MKTELNHCLLKPQTQDCSGTIRSFSANPPPTPWDCELISDRCWMQLEGEGRKGWGLCPGFVQVTAEFRYGTHKAAEINLHFPQNLI